MLRLLSTADESTWLYVAVFATFGLTLTFGFLYDDTWTIVENSFIRSFRNLGLFFSPDYFRSIPDNNRPVMIVSTMVDYALFGNRPGGYHLHSVLWHLACTFLVYWLARDLLTQSRSALIAAVLFAVHPVHVEPVAAVNFREDLLATAFALAAILLTRRSRRQSRRGSLLLAAVCLMVAVLAKESAAVTPVLLFVTDAAVERSPIRALRKHVIDYAILIAAGLCLLPFFTAFESYTSAASPAGAGPLSARALTFCRLLVVYSGQLLLPLWNQPEYVGVVTGTSDWRNWASLLVLALATVAVVRVMHRHPLVAWAATFFALALLPTSNLVPIFNPRADRYLYLPSVGFCVLAAWALMRATGSMRSHRARWLVPALCTALALTSVVQSLRWRDDVALWTFALKKAPESRRAWEAAALALAMRQQSERSLDIATRGLARFPRNSQLLMARGISHSELGRHEAAVEDFRAALRNASSANRSRLHNNVGVALTRLERHREAEQAYARAVQLKPTSSLFHRHLAEALEAQGKLARARDHYAHAVRLAPHDTKARTGLVNLERSAP